LITIANLPIVRHAYAKQEQVGQLSLRIEAREGFSGGDRLGRIDRDTGEDVLSHAAISNPKNN
jgi:hypothetical protein